MIPCTDMTMPVTVTNTMKLLIHHVVKIGIPTFFILLLCAYVSAYSAGSAHLSLPSVKGSIRVSTWIELRDNGIEKQDKDYSCGSASVATILRSFYGKKVTEEDILLKIKALGNDGAASFSDLSTAIGDYGFKGIGLSLNFKKLQTIKIPVIVYLRYRKNDHFSVIRGIGADGTVWLGDPSLGNRQFTKHQFLSMWETRNDSPLKGKVLLVVPENKSMKQVNQAFFGKPVQNTTALQLLSIR